MTQGAEGQLTLPSPGPALSRDDAGINDPGPAALQGSAGGSLETKRTVATRVQSERLVSDRRDRIIRAAIAAYRGEGFHAITTADIAREAGLTQSNLYNYVKSKQDVLFLVCEHLVGTYEALLDEAQGSCADPYLRIVEALRTITRAMCTYRDELQLLYNEAHVLEKPDRVVILSLISRFIGRFETLLEDYGLTTGAQRRLAANFLSFVPAIVALRHWDLAAHNFAGTQEEIVRFVLRGLGLPQPAEGQ